LSCFTFFLALILKTPFLSPFRQRDNRVHIIISAINKDLSAAEQAGKNIFDKFFEVNVNHFYA